jgi:endonuclease/exonuclease/phosphatase family metal-dependent hydrolase
MAALVSASTVTIRIASYNVHCCVGPDGRHNPDRVARVIAELNADVIGLQEIDARYRVEDGVDQADYLGNATGLHAVAGPTMTRENAFYGNALLTRWAPHRVQHFDISVDGRERRALIDAEIDIAGVPVRILATHFGLSLRERRLQTAVLLGILGEATEPVTVLCGDFNEWVPRWPTVRRLDQRLGRSRSVRTFPSRWPTLGLDRIWVQPNQAVQSVHAHQSKLARTASDHLPLVVSVEIPLLVPAFTE